MYSRICSSVTPPRLALPLRLLRRSPESEPEPDACESLAPLEEEEEEDGAALRRLLRRWRLRPRRGEPPESEVSSESDGDRRRRRRDELRLPSASRSFLGMSAGYGRERRLVVEIWRADGAEPLNGTN